MRGDAKQGCKKPGIGKDERSGCGAGERACEGAVHDGLSVTRIRDLRLDESASSVRVTSLLVDNNILFQMNPHLVASHEQLAFMVAMEPDQVYFPCSDRIALELLKESPGPLVDQEYERAWSLNMALLASMGYGQEREESIAEFCRMRFERAKIFHDVIPSRLVKRLTSFVLAPKGSLADIWSEKKRSQNERELALLERAAACLQAPVNVSSGATLEQQREMLDQTLMARHASLCVQDVESLEKRQGDFRHCFEDPETELAKIWDKVEALSDRHSTILMLCDAEGGAVFDLALARMLVERGHRVIYAVKEEFYFSAPTMRDMLTDPTLSACLAGGRVVEDNAVSKNELLELLRSHGLLVVSDGTRERLNLLRVSVTFARAWKEADLVLAKGWRIKDTLLGTSHDFTRDILCFETGEYGAFRAAFKPKAPTVRKFGDDDIAALADGIIADMKRAKGEGRPIVFYSCIIGSIPGQTKTAIRLARVICEDLQKRLPNAFIINPAGHFVEGMDGDDLMYMWERVQRSGLINIWFFETVDDIERGFALLGESVPKEWIGKDATYSTGCTKEMRIALDMQKANPEMQIRGPAPDNFFRRGEYGVGKYFDVAVARR